MRDPQRIQKFCNELAEIWETQCPDWRFGQLIANVFGDSDPFYLEEGESMERLRAYFASEEVTEP